MAVEIDAIPNAQPIGWADALLTRLGASLIGAQSLTLSGDLVASTMDGTPAGTLSSSIATIAASLITTHAAVTSSVHGISAFGATLVDDANAAAARTTLGLGTAATTASTAYEASGAVATHAALTSGIHGLGTASQATLATLLSDLAYTQSSRVLASASTGASVTLPLATTTLPGLALTNDVTATTFAATKRFYGRNTASGGAGEEVTVDQALDWVAGSAASGDILYRSTSAYARVAAGTAGGLMYQGGGGTPAPAWSSKWTLASSGLMTVAGGTVTTSTPLLDMSQTWNAGAVSFIGIKLDCTRTAQASTSRFLQILSGGTEMVYVNKDGDICTAYGFIRSANYLQSLVGQLYLTDNAALIGMGSTTDLYLYRDAAAILAQRNSTTTQTFRVYNTWSTSRTNYENLAISGTTGSMLSLTCESGGTGSANLDLSLTPIGTGRVRFGTHSAIAAETVTGYITIKDSGGTSRKIAVVS